MQQEQTESSVEIVLNGEGYVEVPFESDQLQDIQQSLRQPHLQDNHTNYNANVDASADADAVAAVDLTDFTDSVAPNHFLWG